MWLVLLENGATHGVTVSDAITPEEAIKIAYDSIKGICGLERDKVHKVAGVFNLSKLEQLNKGLGLYNYQLVKRD